MSIASRIEAIEQHLTDDYSVLTLAGADLTNVDKNIINLKPTWKERLLYFMNNGTDVVWNNWDKVTGEGEQISLNNTLEGKMKIDLKGNTYQDSTTGKNLFSGNYSQFDSTGGTGTTYGYFKLPDDGETYTLSVIAKNDFTATLSQYIGFSKNGGTATGGFWWLIQGNQTYTKGQKYTIHNSQQGTRLDYVSIYANNSTTLEQLMDNFYIQLEKGNGATDYEPYTNGASPNPDYPQDVHVVSGDNTIKVEGKNLFSGYTKGIGINGTTGAETADANAGASDYIPLHVTADNKYKIWGLPTTISSFVAGYNSKKEFLGRTGGVTLGEFTLAPQFFVGGTPQGTGDIEYIRVHSYKISTSTGTINDIDNAKVMLEAGTTATSYEPYQSQSYPINLGDIELCKIGDYQDSIKKSTGKNLWNGTFELGGIDTTTGQDGAATDRVRTKGYVEVKPNTTYTLSGVQGSRVVCFYNSSKAYLSYAVVGSQSTSGTFTTPNNTSYIRWYVIQTNTNINEMLNEGSTALPYEPYGNGDWYLEKKIGKVVLNGSEDSWVNDGGGAPYKYVISDIKNPSSNAYTEVYCDNYYPVPYSSNWNNYDYLISRPAYTSTTQGVKFKNKDISSLNDFKTWLGTHNTEVYYILVIPQYIKIEGELANQLDKLSGAKSYNSQTNISQESNDLASLLNATALEEMA